MKHTYTIERMTCGNCVAKVQKAIEQLVEVKEVTVQLASPQATIEMERHIATQELQFTLQQVGNYTIADYQDSVVSEAHKKTQSWITTYKPLLLIVAFILGVSIITAVQQGSLQANLIMRSFMAGFFIVFSFFKLLDLKGFADSYATYDLLAARLRTYGVIYPFIELALGIAYLINFNPTLTNTLTVVILGFSAIGVIQSVLDKRKIKCACLGTVFNLPMSTVTIVEDIGMVVMAIIIKEKWFVIMLLYYNPLIDYQIFQLVVDLPQDKSSIFDPFRVQQRP